MRRTAYARRERDFAYLKWIRSLPCFLCGAQYGSEAAHIGIRAMRFASARLNGSSIANEFIP